MFTKIFSERYYLFYKCNNKNYKEDHSHNSDILKFESPYCTQYVTSDTLNKMIKDDNVFENIILNDFVDIYKIIQFSQTESEKLSETETRYKNNIKFKKSFILFKKAVEEILYNEPFAYQTKSNHKFIDNKGILNSYQLSELNKYDVIFTKDYDNSKLIRGLKTPIFNIEPNLFITSSNISWEWWKIKEILKKKDIGMGNLIFQKILNKDKNTLKIDVWENSSALGLMLVKLKINSYNHEVVVYRQSRCLKNSMHTINVKKINEQPNESKFFMGYMFSNYINIKNSNSTWTMKFHKRNNIY